MSFFQNVLKVKFIPHGHCLLWKKNLIFLHGISDILIGLSYLSIPFAILYYMKRKDIEERLIPTLFVLFIVFCGLTHFFTAWNIWHTHYWTSGFVKLFSAIISALTAIFLWKLMPQVLSWPTVKELKRSNEILDQKIKDRTNILQLKNQDLEMLNSFLSHDIKTPLNVITGYAEMLENFRSKRENHYSEEEKKCIEKIINSSGIIHSMVQSLSKYSTIGTTQLEKTKFSLLENLNIIKGQFEEKLNILKAVIVVGYLPKIYGDKTLIGQVFQNLIQNSIKYRRNDRILQIEITSEENDSFHIIKYKDNGQGVDPHELERIFDYRFQANRKKAGHGIGLTICKKIMASHNGKIVAFSEQGKGIELQLHFPKKT